MNKKRTRRSYEEKGFGLPKQTVLCYCPKCENTHKVELNWTGNGTMPRIFCDYCRGRIGKLKGLPTDVEGNKHHLSRERHNGPLVAEEVLYE